MGLSIMIGVPDVMPKLVAFRFIQPVFHQEFGAEVICRELGLDFES